MINTCIILLKITPLPIEDITHQQKLIISVILWIVSKMGQQKYYFIITIFYDFIKNSSYHILLVMILATLRVTWSIDRKERSVYYFHIKSNWGNWGYCPAKIRQRLKRIITLVWKKKIKVALFWLLRIEPWYIGKKVDKFEFNMIIQATCLIMEWHLR